MSRSRIREMLCWGGRNPDTHLQTFLVMKDTGHQNSEGGLSDSSFLAGKSN